MLKLLNWWPNLYRENDPDEMSDAWAVSLTDVPYDAAMAGAVALSRTMKWPPTVAEIREAAKPYICSGLPWRIDTLQPGRPAVM